MDVSATARSLSVLPSRPVEKKSRTEDAAESREEPQQTKESTQDRQATLAAVINTQGQTTGRLLNTTA